ncbi:hypothetical protein Q5H93_11290 [Hymenobacter sp. ASUV-10]|uniref:Uncharacterized protein n=1 Tax=Hymenobacter aranciens TaxID=3063996 RepID=A0ABT9BCE6_9BACT|nr:hypothetical protein [Hymenobacter sp. ASUV-10]MDO7875318.1 hypothetical protein [Hymenobacter sp. ASUV-10]
MTEALLLRVQAAWPLPGLGLLVLPAGPTPALAGYALHAALTVRLELPDGPAVATATVEEVSHGAAPVQALLLHDLAQTAVPGGTAVWLVETV